MCVCACLCVCFVHCVAGAMALCVCVCVVWFSVLQELWLYARVCAWVRVGVLLCVWFSVLHELWPRACVCVQESVYVCVVCVWLSVSVSACDVHTYKRQCASHAHRDTTPNTHTSMGTLKHV